MAVSAVLGVGSVYGQLAITESMSSASTNLADATVVQGPDFWELTNFGTNSMDLSGYIFNDSDATRGGDADSTTLQGVTIAPGESIILVQTGTTVVNNRDDFINWWGAANVPSVLQVVFYSGNGQSSTGDGLVLWAPDATSDADFVDRVDFPEATRGQSFTYNPTNAVYGVLSSNGVGGAFKAVTADDVGSPGFTTGPVPLKILSQPSPTNVTVPASLDVTFTVVAQGLPRPHYQWRFGGLPIEGAIQSSLTISNAQLTNSGLYSVVVSNGLQSIVSANAVLDVTATPIAPLFVKVPKDSDAFIGQTVQLSALATGSPTPSYQWLTNGVAIPGATSPTLDFFGVQPGDAATYTVFAYNTVATNMATAVLTVGEKPRLAITEVHSTGSSVRSDWWEVTSFDTRTFNLKGWRWDDNSHTLINAYTFTNDIFIHPGESVVFTESQTTPVFTPADFRAWWGTNLPADLQIITYTGGGLGLSSGADEVNLWNAVSLPGNELTERIAGVNFASSPVGVTFVYDPENPPLGSVMGVFVTNTVNDASVNGVITSTTGDVGSPGRLITPIRMQSTLTSNNQVLLSWNSANNRSYELTSAPDLRGGGATTNSLTATGTNTSLIVPTVLPEQYYRVQAVIPFVPQP